MAKDEIDIRALCASLDAARKARDLSWRQMAGEIGVTPSLLSRLRNGYKPDADGFMTLVRWLGMPAEDFMVDEANKNDEEEPDLVAELAPLLRARRDLDPEDVAYLEEVIQATLRLVAAKREGM